jgi:hypothetical protein
MTKIGGPISQDIEISEWNLKDLQKRSIQELMRKSVLDVIPIT